MAYVAILFVSLPFSLFALAFALSNTARVDFSLWPAVDGASIPLNILGVALLFGGFLMGALFVSLQTQKMRFDYWRQARKLAKLEKDSVRRIT